MTIPIYYTGSLTPPSSGGTVTVDSELSLSSENPVQNKVITGALDGKQDVLTAGNNITIQNNTISAVVPSTTPCFSINNGNKNAQGTMDVLSYSGQTLSFKVDDGTTYEPLNMTTGWGEQVEKTTLNTVSTSSLVEATYNCFIPKTGNQPYLLNNTIFVQAEKPVDTDTDTIPLMTSNTTPLGQITWDYNGAPSNTYSTVDSHASYLYNAFKQGLMPDTSSQAVWGTYATIPNLMNGTYYRTVDFPFTYTYDENNRPQAGTYLFKYVAALTYPVRWNTVKIYYEDNTSTTISRSNSRDSFSQTITTTSPIVKIEFRIKSYNGDTDQGKMGTIQLLKPAIIAEGTIWVNNGVEPLEVMARDANTQWQPFYDVLAGTVTVNASYDITAIANIGFNYFSTINMHNISTTAHEDIREDIDAINTTITSISRTGTTSYQGLTKLYTSTGNNTDGTMTQNAITTELNNKTSKFTVQNIALTPDANNKVTWTISNTLNTADIIVMIRKVSDNSVVQSDIITTTSTITITMNADSDVSANTYRAVIIG